MFRDKHIKIVIATDGACSVDAINFIGPSCQTATNEITAALAGNVLTQRGKPEARIREPGKQEDREAAR